MPPAAPVPSGPPWLRMQLRLPAVFSRVTTKQLVLFTRQLATLVRAGMPLLRALHTIEEQLDEGVLRDATRRIAEDVEGGVSCSEALARHPRVFPEFYVNMIRAGELGGLLDEILQRLAEFLEKQNRLASRVRSALVYPSFVLGAAGLILLLLMLFVVPTFISMFKDLGGALPLPTRILIAICGLVRHGWWLLAVLGALLVAGYRAAAATTRGRFLLDGLALRAPLFGTLIEGVAVARFARTLGTLLTSGVPILAALETVEATVGNTVVSRAIGQVRERIKEGESVAGPMEAVGVFPPLVVRMVALGEETGQLDKMLVQIAASFEEEVDLQVASLTQLLEPVLIIGLGLAVGFIVISMFMPLFTLAKLLG